MDAKEVKERLNKVISLYNSKNYEMALVELDDLANTVPDLAEVYFWRGKTLATDLNEENLKAAKEEFTEAIRLKEDFADAYFERGLVNLQLGELKESEKDFLKAVELNPKLKESYVYLAQIKLSEGKDEEALKYLQKAAGSEENYKYFFYFGKIYFNNKDYEKAIEYLSKAIEKNPYLVDAYDLRGQALREIGKYKEAVEDFKRAYTLMPEERRFFDEITYVYFILAEKEYEKNNIEKSADYIVEGLEINYNLEITEKLQNILIEAGKMNIDKNPQKAILYFDFAIRNLENKIENQPQNYNQYKTEIDRINSLRKKAISNLPLKERIVKIISDIYS